METLMARKPWEETGMVVLQAESELHPPGHNPHAHIMLTMRAMDEHGKWLPKSRKVYDLDENGERIKLPWLHEFWRPGQPDARLDAGPC